MLSRSNSSKLVNMQCQPYSEEKRLDFWVEKVDLLHYF